MSCVALDSDLENYDRNYRVGFIRGAGECTPPLENTLFHSHQNALPE